MHITLPRYVPLRVTSSTARMSMSVVASAYRVSHGTPSPSPPKRDAQAALRGRHILKDPLGAITLEPGKTKGELRASYRLSPAATLSISEDCALSQWRRIAKRELRLRGTARVAVKSRQMVSGLDPLRTRPYVNDVRTARTKL